MFTFVTYLKIGYRVWGGEPGGARVLLVAKGSVEGLGDGAPIEGTDGGSRYAVPKGLDRSESSVARKQEGTTDRIQQN